jgi:transcriptional regulator with XRE-family HTH domain
MAGKNPDMAVKERIRQRMDELDLGVAVVAKGARVTKSAVYQWLDGTTEPGIGALVYLAEILKTYEKWIATGHGPKDRGAWVALEPDEAALLLAYKSLGTDTKEAVYAVALQLSATEKKKSDKR